MQKETKKKRANSKKAISLIVLVITIIVMVILAGAVILTLNNSGIITRANTATRNMNTKTVEEMANVYWAEAYASGKRTQTDLESYVTNAFTNSGIDISGYDLTVTTKGVEVEKLIGIKLSSSTLELAPEESATITVTMNEVAGTASWTNSNEEVVTLSNTTGNSVTVTGVSEGTTTISVILGEYIKTCSINVKEPFKPGDFIEYNVEYSDIVFNSNRYTSTNGWRLQKATRNNDGTYSNVLLISTGLPVRIHLKSDDTVNSSWYVRDDTLLNSYKETHENNYLYYTGDEPYYALQVAAGLYYNFGDIKFNYSNKYNWPKDSFGQFYDITSNNVMYNSTTNSTVVKTGNELFNLFGNNAKVRTLTFPEVIKGLGRTTSTNYRIEPTISSTEDLIGLYLLKNLTESLTGIDDFQTYTQGDYLLASPMSDTSSSKHLPSISANGGIFGVDSNLGIGLRPVIEFTSPVQFVDTNGNGVPEIQIAQ